MNQVIPHSRPWITKDDCNGVIAVLSSSMLAQGVLTRTLEQRLAFFLQSAGGVAVGSGSAALVLALHGLGIGRGDEVVIPTYVCRSVFQAVLSSGATPVLCDVGLNWAMTPTDTLRVLSSRTRAIVIPHLYGIFTDIDAFRELGIPIIEDCAQALDITGKYPAKGDVTVLSFHPTKCLTSGEGGMALSSNSNILECMRTYRDGGLSKGLHSRFFSPMSDFTASLALTQLDRYEVGMRRRREIALAYIEAVKIFFPLALNKEALKDSMFFRFPLSVPGGLEVSEHKFAKFGVQVRKGVDYLLHREIGLPDVLFPSALKLFETTVSIPIYPDLSRSEESRCIEAISKVLQNL